MSKRGGTTEVNGFISFAPDKKTVTTLKKDQSRRRGSVEREDKKKELLKTKKSKRDDSLDKYKESPKHRQGAKKPDLSQKKNETHRSNAVKVEKSSTTVKQPNRMTNEKLEKTIHINEDKQQKLKTGKVTRKTTLHQSSPKMRPKHEDLKQKSKNSVKTSDKARPLTKTERNTSDSRKKVSRMTAEELDKISKRSIEKIRNLTSSLEEKLKSSPKKMTKEKSSSSQNKDIDGYKKEERINSSSVGSNDYGIQNSNYKSDIASTAIGSTSLPEKRSLAGVVDHSEESDSYEDDFESYESDFEECTESGVSGDEDFTSSDEEDDNSDLDTSFVHSDKPVVEEERKLDSGSYDLSTQKQQHQLNEIKDALQKENSSFLLTRNLLDGQGEAIPNKNGKISGSDKIFINFADAKQRQLKQKINEKVQKRGACLMEMINLDTMMFSLLDMPSVPYEIYIKCYGKSNTQQMQTQTNDDCLNEEVQTEEIQVTNKWTQHPIKFHPLDSSPELFMNRFIMDRRGVGDDEINKKIDKDDDDEWQTNLNINSIRLQTFLLSASEVILMLLEEEEQAMEGWNGKSILSENSKAISDGFTTLNFKKVDFLTGRQITGLKFSSTSMNQMITVHKESEQQTPCSLREECLGRCMICLWNVYKHSSPQKILVSPASVMSAQLQAHLVYAGLCDGSICVWDLREKSAWHQRTGLHGLEHTLRSPTYITAKVLNETSHTSPVVALECCNNNIQEESQKNSTYQIASLEVDGIIIIWTVVQLLLSKHDGESMGNMSIPGLAPWGHVRLVPSVSINLLQNLRTVQEKLECKALSVSDNHIFVGANTGMIAHCLKGNSKGQPPYYYSSKEGASEISCIQTSPTGDPLFLTASDTGRINLYQRKIRNPMIELIGTVFDPGPPIKSICWSPAKQNIFFVLDGESRIHVWDLCCSDFTPSLSIPKKDSNITAMSISPHADEPLLALSTDKGTIEIHKLNEAMSKDISKRESEMFKHYLNIVCC